MSMGLRGLDGQALPNDVVAVYLNRKTADDLEKAVGEVPYRLSAAARIFKMIGRLSSCGFGLEESELWALCELAGAALDHAADTEGEKVAMFGTCLRVAITTAEKREV